MPRHSNHSHWGVFVFLMGGLTVFADAPSLPEPRSALTNRLLELRPDVFKFTPPASASVSDRSGNDPSVVPLPPFYVRRRKEPTLHHTDVLTKDALSDLLFHLYPGASLKGQDPVRSHAPNYAQVMYADDKQREQYQNFHELSVLGPMDKSEAKKLNRALQDTFIRKQTPLEHAMDKSYNAGRY